MIDTPEPEVALEGGAPIRRQIRDQIRASIRSGLLHPGEPLPSVRALAVALAINPGAVEQAYAALEREGFVTMEDQSGAFVAEPAVWSTDAARSAQLERLCTDFLTQAARLGFPAADVSAAIHALTQRRLLS
jgi:GntR family transcriptional regulator